MNAIIDNHNFIDYISKFTKNIPKKLKDKEELKIKLENRNFSIDTIEIILQSTNLK